MSRGYGFEREDRERDFPDLNKCPDCETFFADLHCPLCGKECPEEMRAGNRPAVKPSKRHRPSGSDRVTFVPWYLSTPFILIMLFIQPLIGLILLWLGGWRRQWKIVATTLLALLYLLPIVMGVVAVIASTHEEYPVAVELSQAEYQARCREVEPEELYRNAASYGEQGAFVRLTLTVGERLTNEEDYGSEYDTYYLCYAEVEGRTYSFLLRDWRQSNGVNFAGGDVITVWGEAAGELTLYNTAKGQIALPGVHFLYAELH